MCVPVRTVLASRRVVTIVTVGHVTAAERDRERDRESKTERKKERERLEAKRPSVNVMRNKWPPVTHK